MMGLASTDRRLDSSTWIKGVVTLICPTCGKTFARPAGIVASEWRRRPGRRFYCSALCKARANALTADGFWSRVDRSGGPDACWPWTAGRFQKGYEMTRWQGRTRGAHRVAYELAYGPILDGLWVLHDCDNPPCCNPAHLFPGNSAVNADDRERKGRGIVLKGEQAGGPS
jgi:hypothetical protein